MLRALPKRVFVCQNCNRIAFLGEYVYCRYRMYSIVKEESK